MNATETRTLLVWLKEPSTLRGLTLVAGLLGYTLDPAAVDHVVTLALAALATIEVFRKE